MQSNLQDLRYGSAVAPQSRILPSAVLAAALESAASTAVFSAVDPNPVSSASLWRRGRLVSVGIMAPLDTNEFLHARRLFDLRRHPGPFDAVTSFQAGSIPCDLNRAQSAPPALPAC